MSLEIRPIDVAHRGALAGIWVPWLKETIGLDPEPEDVLAMADPAAYYGGSGGDALLALLDGEVVGGVALKGLGPAGFEFCKLVVTDAARGHGVGRALVEACLDFCAHRRATLWLQSFNRLEVALGLYRRMEFQDAPPPAEMNVLGRTEVIMNMPPRGAG
ncbi:GNAT family N-acetyltransferase [Phenylobacterium sp.]|uniref:GNAT family N-acetyltransferase n=1 Tax=Phenylobacterium sp. TaxID=1871053 RepID=UPI0025F33CBE|nr:GNAT family N-acetyltransferase [Phenylobacterium sp.]